MLYLGCTHRSASDMAYRVRAALEASPRYEYAYTIAESGTKERNPASKHQPIRFSLRVENERAGAGRDGRTRLARPNP